MIDWDDEEAVKEAVRRYRHPRFAAESPEYGKPVYGYVSMSNSAGEKFVPPEQVETRLAQGWKFRVGGGMPPWAINQHAYDRMIEAAHAVDDPVQQQRLIAEADAKYPPHTRIEDEHIVRLRDQLRAVAGE